MKSTNSQRAAWAAMVLLVTPLVLNAQTQIPAAVNYQGRLTDALGAPLTNGYYIVEFRIWDDPTKTGAGNYIWGRQFPIHVVIGGLFNVLLSDDGGQVGAPRTNDIRYAFGGPNRYLGLTITADPFGNIAAPIEISPRQRLVSAPYALQAQTAIQVIPGGVGSTGLQDGAVTTPKLATGAVTADKVADGAVTTSKISIDADLNMNQHTLLLRANGDYNHTLRYDGTVNGPVLTGFSGGALATTVTQGNPYTTNLAWTIDGTVSIPGKLKVNYSGLDTYTATLRVADSAGDGAANQNSGIAFLNNLDGGFGHAAIYAVGSGGFNGNLIFATDGDGMQNFNTTEKMRITYDGRVGIGTANPSKGWLEVQGNIASPLGNYAYLSTVSPQAPANYYSGNAGNVPISIYASDRIVCVEFDAFSDARIKKVKGRSDGRQDLQSLLNLEITDYTLVDSVTKGNRSYKKVIGQQVERIYPQAVSRTTEVVPDLYVKTEARDGWIPLATNLAAALKAGDRVKLITDRKTALHEVGAVSADGFRIKEALSGPVFVYGREVSDFRVIDYEAIAMLNVSATQELHRRLQATEAQATALKQRNDALESRLAELEAREQKQAARFAELERRLQRLPAEPQQAALR